jgi:hypothetical protein
VKLTGAIDANPHSAGCRSICSAREKQPLLTQSAICSAT